MPSTRGSGFEPIDEPIRAELFSVERLEQHAHTLAEAQEVSGRRGRLRLISRIQVSNPNGVTRGVMVLTLDGTTLPPGSELKLVDDGYTHQVRVVLG